MLDLSFFRRGEVLPGATCGIGGAPLWRDGLRPDETINAISDQKLVVKRNKGGGDK